MHQHQLLAFGCKIGLIPATFNPLLTGFTAESYTPLYSLLPPTKASSTLTPTQFKHLQQHYMTVHLITSLQHPELVNMDHNIQIWYRCRVDKTIFHCRQSERRNSTRLNYLLCIEQDIDANANFSYRTRPERMVPAKFYVYVEFYCLHYFRGPQLLMYSEYRKVDVHDGLVEDKGHHLWGFQDIRVIQHMCARVQAAEGRVYFVDERETMEQRLREALGAR